MPATSHRRASRTRLSLFRFTRLPLLRFAFLVYLLCLALMLWMRPARAATALPVPPPAECGVSMSCQTAPDMPKTPAPSAGPGACGPAAGGAPCNGAPAVASLGNQGGVNVGAGNPINVISGNKYQREDDLPALPGVLGLEIVRHYNSAYSNTGNATGILGRGWKLSYETDLYLIGNTLQVMQADGTRIIFNRDPANRSLCSTANPANGRMQIVRRSRGEDYTWTWPDGRILNFNSDGKLVQIVAPTGEFVSLQRDAKGLLVQVTDPQGRQLRMQYPDQAALGGNRFGGVATIVSPVGTFGYRYGSSLPAGASVAAATVAANLVGVTYPDNSGRIYHHEDVRRPTFLTGISVTGTAAASARPATAVSAPQRIATYLYGVDGRAVLTVRGTPARLQLGADGKPLSPARLVEGSGIGQVVLDFATPGQTRLTNGLGQTTLYRHAIVGDEFRILEVRGAGCFQCGEMNMRYGYDKLGRLTDTTQLTAAGAPLATVHTDLDAFGRVTRTTRMTHARGKTGTPVLQARYVYADRHPMPILIARPSVVPGKELITQITYGTEDNHRLLPVEITETGFSPAVDGTGDPQAINRTQRYGYDFHGHRIEADGPLPNAPGKPGPDNSDITRSEHDQATGLLIKSIAPGGIVTEIIERDAALRATKIRSSDGSVTQTTTVTHNWRGQPTQITVTAAFLRDGTPDPDSRVVRTLSYGYDVQGAISYITLPGNRTSRFVRDGAGRIVQRILPDGSRIAIELDGEDRTLATSSIAGGKAPLSTTRYRYDALNRMIDVDDPIGRRQHLEYSDTGQIAALTNAMGTTMRLAYDDNGMLIAQTRADNTPDAARMTIGYDSHGMATSITDPNGVTTRRLVDDFGRKVLEVSPDRGVTLFRHDLAGHVVARIDETGVTVRYRHDHANRLVAMGVDRTPDLVSHAYQGMRLIDTVTVADDNPKQVLERTRYRTNALGQVTWESRWMAKVDAPRPGPAAGIAQPGLTLTTGFAYDGAGRLTTVTLPDRHRITYRYGDSSASASSGSGANDERTLHRAGAGGALREILFDDRIIVTDIGHDASGSLTGYTTGSGIRQQIDVDVRGQIVALRAVTEARRPDVDAAGSWSQVEAWFKRRPVASGSVIYSQSNVFDGAGRLIDLRRQPGTSTPRWTPPLQVEHFGYDRLDRLTSTDTDGAATQIRYDAGGNRIAETSPQFARRYHYGTGANRLVALIQTVEPAAAGTTVALKTMEPAASGKQLQTAWFYHPTGVPLAQWNAGAISQSTDRQSMPDASRRIVYNSARRPIAVHDGGNRLLARYFYNAQGERIAKSVYVTVPYLPAANPGKAGMTPVGAQSTPTSAASAPAQTTYSLYRDQRLSAEADADGHITAHYLYLDGKPIAKIDMRPDTGASQSLSRAVTVVKSWLSLADADARDTVASIHAIHTDHLGTPQAVTDDQQRIVWQAQTDAFGTTKVIQASTEAVTGKPYVMNLRLPGQVFDAETGLHQNYHRDYDPQLGRYTTPDPMGLAGGMNPYAYVDSNPLTRIDPLGLYDIDIHYYMTYFLAVNAGLSEEKALAIALATQYIDDNPNTRPIDFGSLSTQAERLRLYHFTQAGNDVPQKAGQTSLQYEDDRVKISTNPQLTNLLNASNRSDNKPCTRLQLFGEYLHTFEDTFGHRNQLNEPITVNLGFGHLTYGHEPDKTYNETVFSLSYPLANGVWSTRESRTLEMERAVFNKIQLEFGGSRKDKNGSVITFAGLEPLLRKFNAIQETEGNTIGFEGKSDKIKALNKALSELGLPNIEKYSVFDACKSRQTNLQQFNSQNDTALIVATPDHCVTVRPK